MFNPTDIALDGFVDQLNHNYSRIYAGLKLEFPGVVEWIGRMALERIADSDALYHDLDHTMQCTLVGQKIIEGRHVRDGTVHPEAWLCAVLALLCRSIGYGRGICTGDTGHDYVVSGDGRMVTLPVGASDAALAPCQIERARIFVRERFAATGMVDIDQVRANIDRTRFPVPDDPAYAPTNDYPGLVRAGDLIGQLADPHYMRRMKALFVGFRETGRSEAFGYPDTALLAEGYTAVLLRVGASLYPGWPALPAGHPGRQALYCRPVRPCFCCRTSYAATRTAARPGSRITIRKSISLWRHRKHHMLQLNQKPVSVAYMLCKTPKGTLRFRRNHDTAI